VIPAGPDFIIGGAPRSGTTYLCRALSGHPQVFIPRPFIPEPKVFLLPLKPGETYGDRYADIFAPAAPGQLKGEKTTNYLENAWACRLIHRTLGPVRMIFMVREPVARAYSNWLWSRLNGLEKLPFEEAVASEGKRDDPLGAENPHARPFDYLCRGDYATLARPYCETMGFERVKFFLFEDIVNRPLDLLRRVQEWLGLDPLPGSRLDPGMVNPAAHTGPPIDRVFEETLRRRMKPKVERFAELSGLDLSEWGY